MGKLEQKADGYYILDLDFGAIKIKKAFMDADKPLAEISDEPKNEGFYLDIPEKRSEKTDKKE